MPQDTNLHKAAAKGELQAVEELIEQGEDVNSKGAQNRTALHRAVGKDFEVIVKFLLEHQADCTAVDSGGLTPLHWAALFGFFNSGTLVLDACPGVIDAQTNSGETALHLAAQKNHRDFVKILLDRGAKTDIHDKSANGGLTAYDVAKKANARESMELLKPAGGAGGGCCVIM